MADRWTMKQHDTWPPLPVTLKDATGPVSLSAVVQIRMIMKPATGGGSTIIGVLVPDPDQTGHKGQAIYPWAPGDTAIAATYNAEFEADWGSGRIETFPNAGYNTIEIQAELG